jgi:hypothetical protein
MPLQHQAVQATHAGIAAGRDLIRCEQPYLVLLTVPTQHELIKLSCHLTKHVVKHKVFHEDDMGGRPTALATEPIGKEDAKRRLFKGLRIYRATSEVAA